MRASARFSIGPISEEDMAIYKRVLPAQSLLLDTLNLIPWAQVEEKLQKYYSTSNEGQPEYSPLRLLKLEFLCHLYHIGRQKALERARCDLHWKFFLDLPIRADLPDHSTLCVFRKRLGVEGFKEVFDWIISVAREKGLISDRLRLKDATHIYADIAVPTSLGLFAQLRGRMLAAIQRFDAGAAESFEIDVERMRQLCDVGPPEDRLAARVEMVKDLLFWIRSQKPPEGPSNLTASQHKHWQAMQTVGDLADKILFDQANPDAGDRTRSVVDPDARCGMHGKYYDGYLVDVMMDAESELVTSVDVLPANGKEAANAVLMVKAEEEAQGNDIEQLSIDGIGFNGEVLQELTDEAGLNMEVFTPPRDFTTSKGFDSSEFTLIDEGERVKCPAGEVSGKAGRKADKPNTKFYEFSHNKCAGCTLRQSCHPNFKPEGRSGRRVSKNDYELQYTKAREVSQTEAYAEVRRKHPAIERKLNELVRHRGTRRTKHRGRTRVKMEQLMTAVSTNIKRMVRLRQIQSGQTGQFAFY